VIFTPYSIHAQNITAKVSDNTIYNEKKKKHTVGTVPISNRKIAKTEAN
jgi:hypothetical protein